jgi:hypothetical protein
MQNISRGYDPDGFAMLLVALNLLMLCLFVLLNSLATTPTPEQKKHQQKILAAVQEGYDVVSPQVAEEATTPLVPTAPWAEDMASKLQGVVVNRLQMNAAQMETDADRVVLTIPLENIFAENKLIGAEVVRALILAAQESSMVWVLDAAPENLMKWAPELAAVTGQVTMQSEGIPALKLIVRPNDDVPPSAGRGLQTIGTTQGASVTGESAP